MFVLAATKNQRNAYVDVARSSACRCGDKESTKRKNIFESMCFMAELRTNATQTIIEHDQLDKFGWRSVATAAIDMFDT